ncbi:MAG: tRNA (N6-threonylcarbamoyladenosine(37)-N6)-methyltransferase TrmO [Bacteroidaceae bacterium]|nr:tRNA (N6-threonylcarbamoyladenosine(37)-N6)-methyltransferase TrmO [Bacteroidaceae bacterium]MBR3985031.1 tRNA (N6-threonylcarbamoyladenosine(37)-N6)-methyltransferase TrmO [Bacteroidaceae bacterium]MBR4041338.1 tRNA (N6-threonylcarbamoyladenosine(37)-N6)-methyltransferase TrmO [Bacteroidaceae bacterium]MBR6630046.1 tRNA (N6-threonylcarbamoyladenosine(37)-N6)-methyltransferase TrmO [Bacteroidaceae bacterium]
MTPIAHFHSAFPTKFGIPRQSGIVAELRGRIVFEPPYRNMDALRGLDGFDYLWILWEFSANKSREERGATSWQPTVRPPLLGGNTQMGVFATRSPYRPNPIGLSSVRIERIELSLTEGPVIHVLGADLMDGTPIYDIKPYVTYADCHPDARSGFVDERRWQELAVAFPLHLQALIKPESLEALTRVLALDPRPQYQDNPEKVYGMPFEGYDIRFTVADGTLTVVDIEPL